MCPDSVLARQFDAEVWAQGDVTQLGGDDDDETWLIEHTAFCFGKIVRHPSLVAPWLPPPGPEERHRTGSQCHSRIKTSF